MRGHMNTQIRISAIKNLWTSGVCGMLILSIIVFWGKETSATTIQVGPTRTYKTPAAAAAAANDGDVIEIDAGTYTTGCVATWIDNNLTIRGVGGMARLNATGLSISNGKGIWVIQGDNTTVEYIEFTGARVADKNGAGIRQEGNNLTVRHCYFHHNENGILTSANLPNCSILIEYSEFGYNGYGDGYSHNLYINHVSKLTFRYNYSHHANIGHLLKSRAAENHIVYNRLSDEATGNSSYVIDLPNGGRSYIIGNLLHQGTHTDNSTLLRHAAEGATNPWQELYISGNTFVSDLSSGTAIRMSETPTVRIVNNLVDNFATALSGTYSGTVSNNIVGTNSGFVNRSNYDYHLTASSPARNAGINPGSAQGVSLVPTYEYVHPAKSTPRTSVGVIDVGAYEYENANISYILWTR